MTVPRIPPASALALAVAGEASLLDVRIASAFAAGHPRGALSLPYSPRGLGDRARVVLPSQDAVVLVAADDATADDGGEQLAAAGIAVRGAIDGGFDAWLVGGLPVATIEEVTVEALADAEASATIVDVREPIEHDTGHVPDALLIPLGILRDALGSIPRTRPVIIICEAGVRSCTAASLLAASGFAEVAHVPAGTSGYRRAGLPLAFPERAEATR